MLFNSYSFLLAFLPLSLAGYALLAHRHAGASALFMALASLVFYGWSSPLNHVALLIVSISVNFVTGRQIQSSRQPGLRRAWLVFGVTADLLLLCYFKYAGFLLDQFGLSGMQGEILLPLGISFYTFTQIAYLVDLYRHGAEDYDPVHYALFVTWLPHLIAGPILHHREMIPQFRASFRRPARWRLMIIGLSVFAMGLAKKVLLADQSAPIADAVFDRAHLIQLTAAEAWTGALAYTTQIYFDFSGYSDMAIGLSLMYGVRLPLNFHSPYKASSIIEFWRRWHMTLSRFLRDYLYVPLGGNRHGPARRYTNLMATMLIGGLWHGAGWTFIMWGGLHGIYLAVNHAWRATGMKLPHLVSVMITFLAVVVAWVFFRATDFHAALSVLGPMLLAGDAGLDAPFHNGIVAPHHALPTVAGLLAIAMLMPNTQQIFRRVRPALPADTGAWAPQPWPLRRLEWRSHWSWGCAIGLLLAASFVKLGGESPFLYFRF